MGFRIRKGMARRSGCRRAEAAGTLDLSPPRRPQYQEVVIPDSDITMSFYLVLVGTLDNPLYETTFTSTRAPPSAANAPPNMSSPSQQSFSIFGSPSTSVAGKSNVSYGPKNGRHVMQLVAHASLDVVEDVQWVNGYMCVCRS